MTCYCGDLRCWSCGPAQGNYFCPTCGNWADDGSCDDPEKCGKEIKLMNEEEAKYCQELDKIEKEAEEYIKNNLID